MTLPCPLVIMLTADTIAAVSCPERLFIRSATTDGTASSPAFFATFSSGAYLFTKAIKPFPRKITINRIIKTVVIPTTISKSPVSKFSILFIWDG